MSITLYLTGIDKMRAAIERANEAMAQAAKSPRSFVNLAKVRPYMLPTTSISIPAKEDKSENDTLREYCLTRGFIKIGNELTDDECQAIIETWRAAVASGIRSDLSVLIDFIYAPPNRNLATFWSALD